MNRTIEIINKHGNKIHVPLHKKMTTHTARWNFIGNHINKFGTPEAIIKSMSGHSKDSKSFSRYYEVDIEAKIRAIQGMK